MYRLTGQAQRFGAGERWAAFQYAMPDGSAHLLALFRLPGGAPEHSFTLSQLDPQRCYTLRWLGEERVEQRRGEELITNGIHFVLPEEGSAMLLIS